jgi:hypothetical protein
MSNTTTNEMTREMTLDELDAVNAGRTMPVAKKSTAEKAGKLSDKFVMWAACRLRDLGL